MSKNIKELINLAISDEQNFEVVVPKIIEGLKSHKDDKYP